MTAGGNGDRNKSSNLEVAVQYSGPAVLPWLWQPVEHDGEIVLLPQAIPHIAGTSGMGHPYPSSPTSSREQHVLSVPELAFAMLKP